MLFKLSKAIKNHIYTKDNGLKITIEANSKSVDFLDVNFNLTNNTFSPYLKPNNKPLYVNMQSNHPLNVIKNIPLAVNKRLSEISANEEIFQKAAPTYQEALDSSGYKHQLKFEPPQEEKTKHASRKRRVIWFNPPFSQNVATNIGKKFLRIIDEHFPPSSPLHKIFNRNTIKISYRCTPNLGKTISAHNSRILYPPIERKEKNCNCRDKASCPVEGQCLEKNRDLSGYRGLR